MRPLLGLVLLAASRAAHDATDVAKMYEAMRASVDAYGDRYGGQPTADWNASDPRGSASRFLRSYLWKTGGEDGTVLLWNNKILVDRSFVDATGEGKQRNHVRFLASMRELGYKLPNAAYAWAPASTGKTKHGQEPVLVMAKDRPRPGIMVPNPYIATLQDWREFRVRLHEVGRSHPFAERRCAAFWRGKIESETIGHTVSEHHTKLFCEKDFGNYARLRAAALTLDDPEHVDVKCSLAKHCNARTNGSVCDGVTEIRDGHNTIQPMPYTPALEEAAKQPEKLSNGSWTSQADYAKYKYLLNLPGSTHGSYSRNLNHLWFLGAVVLQWRQPAVEWYYAALKDGATHLEVDGDDLIATVKDLERNPSRAAALVEGARDVDQHLLCPKCLADFFVAVLEKLRDAYRMDTVLDDPCAMAAFFGDAANRESIGCDGLELVEIVASHDTLLRERVESWQHSFEDWQDPRTQAPKPSRTDILPSDKLYGEHTHALVDARPMPRGCGWIASYAAVECRSKRGG